MRYAGILGLFLILAVVCRGDQGLQRVGGSNFTGWIVPKATADGWMRTYNNNEKWMDDGQCWTPTAGEAIAAEKAARDLIARAQKDPKVAFPNDPDNALSMDRRQLGEIDKKYSKYGIHFIGVTVNGKKEIFCNYFCLDAIHQLDPTHDFIFFYKGGSCFWRVEYVPATKSCTGLEINSD